MKGLILKDLYTIYGYRKQYALILVFMLVWSGLMKDTGFISVYLLILGGMLVFSSISTDESVHFNRLALTMPISPKTLVLSKYILLIISMGCGTIIAALLSIICQGKLGGRIAEMEWQGMLLTAVLFMAVYSISLPIIFKMGVEKARYIYIAIMLAIALVVLGTVSLLEKLGVNVEQYMISDTNSIFLVLILIGVSAIALVISYLCSLKVIKKKEW